MILTATDENLRKAADILIRGGTVAFPTETVYGLGASALDAEAVARVFEAKERPRFDPLIVHIASKESITALAEKIDPGASLLADALWPGPLTIVVPKRRIVPDIVTAGLCTVALRMPAHPVARKLIAMAGIPVAAPSANPFGFLSPTTARHVEKQLGGRVDLILDGGPCSVGVESTIIAFTGNVPRLLRPGGLPLEDIEAIIGPVERGGGETVEAPGQLSGHYSPRTPVVIIDGVYGAAGENAAYLAFRSAPEKGTFRMVEVLSPTGNLREAAARFFSALHKLDESGADVILAETLPEEGLGRALMDRLRRASQKSP